MARRTSRPIRRPFSAPGCTTVVSTWSSQGSSTPSKPVTVRSSGTRMDRDSAARTTPAASRSACATTAVGRSPTGRSRSSRAAASPASTVRSFAWTIGCIVAGDRTEAGHRPAASGYAASRTSSSVTHPVGDEGRSGMVRWAMRVCPRSTTCRVARAMAALSSVSTCATPGCTRGAAGDEGDAPGHEVVDKGVVAVAAQGEHRGVDGLGGELGDRALRVVERLRDEEHGASCRVELLGQTVEDGKGEGVVEGVPQRAPRRRPRRCRPGPAEGTRRGGPDRHTRGRRPRSGPALRWPRRPVPSH